jgi:hypothetical protein
MVTLKEMVDLAALKVWPELIKVEFKQLIELKLVTLQCFCFQNVDFY